jgi:hypothetical protein
MKKIILMGCIVASTFCHAQSEPRFTIGTKGGFGHSYIRPNGGGFNGSWLIGLTTNYMAGEHLGFGADALYSSEGGRIEMVDGSMGNTEVDYMRVPLRVIYAMNSSESNFRPRISAGPTFGVNMAENTGLKDMDFGLSGSLGFNYKMLEGLWLGTDLSYYHGLMDIYPANSMRDCNGNLRLEISLTFGL